MTFEKIRLSLAIWPPFEAVQIGYTYYISFLFLTVIFRMSNEYIEGIEDEY